MTALLTLLGTWFVVPGVYYDGDGVRGLLGFTSESETSTRFNYLGAWNSNRRVYFGPFELHQPDSRFSLVSLRLVKGDNLFRVGGLYLAQEEALFDPQVPDSLLYDTIAVFSREEERLYASFERGFSGGRWIGVGLYLGNVIHGQFRSPLVDTPPGVPGVGGPKAFPDGQYVKFSTLSRIDTRKPWDDPGKGVYVSVEVGNIFDVKSGAYTFLVRFDGRLYKSFNRHTFALGLSLGTLSNSAPRFLQFRLGGDTLRGYPYNFRVGTGLVLLRTEYRWTVFKSVPTPFTPLHSLLSWVPDIRFDFRPALFLEGGETVSPDKRLPVWTGGGGLRLVLPTEVVLRFDYARSLDGRSGGFVMGLSEAF